MTHQILIQLGAGLGVTAATFVVFAVMIVLGRLIFLPSNTGAGTNLGATVRLTGSAVWLVLAHAGAIALWVILFVATGLSPTVEEGIYFALTTYTTLGFGDIVPVQDWRLLTGLSSANGLMLFGLSAAVIVDASERLRQGRRHL